MRSRTSTATSQGRLYGRLDLTRTAAIGHSLGGAIAMQVAWLDSRTKAAIDLDGWLFDAAGGGWIKQPFLVIGSDGPASTTGAPAADDPNRRYPSILDEETDRRMKAAFAKFGGGETTIVASVHDDFSDAPIFRGPPRSSIAAPTDMSFGRRRIAPPRSSPPPSAGRPSRRAKARTRIYGSSGTPRPASPNRDRVNRAAGYPAREAALHSVSKVLFRSATLNDLASSIV